MQMINEPSVRKSRGQLVDHVCVFVSAYLRLLMHTPLRQQIATMHRLCLEPIQHDVWELSDARIVLAPFHLAASVNASHVHVVTVYVSCVEAHEHFYLLHYSVSY